MDVEIKQIIDELNNSPRFGRPEFGRNIVVPVPMVSKIVKCLELLDSLQKQGRPKLKLKKETTVGAAPQ